MELQIGNSYIITFEIGGKDLTFSCKIIDIDENFITFIDKFGKTLTYNKKKIISISEVENE